MRIEQFEGKEPRFRLEEYFAGQTIAWGMFEDRFGNLKRQFTVKIDGRWDGRELVLVEDFLFDDGEKDQRVWRITKIDEHRYEGRADDVIGVARGISYGNALTWTYDVDLKVGDSSWRVQFEDWMWQQDGEVVINRAEVRKWGIKVGQLTIFFQRQPTGEKASLAKMAG